MSVFPTAVTGRTTLTSGWKVELGIGDPEAIADVGVYDTSRYPDLTSESFFTFPGTVGSYLSTPDVNLLDADTAHLIQGIGPWGPGSAVLFLVNPDRLPRFGINSMQFKPGNTSDWGVTAVSVAAVTAGNTYTYSADVAAENPVNKVKITIAWYDAAQAYLSVSPNSDLWSGLEWSRVSVTAVAPANAAYATLLIGVTDASVSEFCFASSFCFSEGSDPTFIPSMRIVGDLDSRIKLTQATWLDNSNRKAFMGRYSALIANGRPWGVSVGTSSNTARINFTEQTGTEIASDSDSLAGYLTDGTPAEFRFVIDFDGGSGNGHWDVYLDGVLASTKTTFMAGATSLQPGDVEFSVGMFANALWFDGDIYWAEVRDGIDGPVVARFDASDYTGPQGSVPDGTIWKGVTGRTWTTHGTLESVKTEPDTKPIYGSNDPFGYLVDVTSRVEGLSTTRGRERFTSRFRTGTASISVLNTDGAFTPPSGGGPIGILPLRPGRAVKITNNGADVFAGFIDSFTGYQGYDGKVSTSILCVDQFGQFTRNDLPGVTAEGAGDTVVARMRRLLDRHIDDYTFVMMGTPKATFQATEMAQDLMSELALTADSEGGGVWVGKDGGVVASGRDYFSDIATAGLVKWSVGGTNPITIQGYTDEWAAIRILNESHYARAGGTEQIRTNDESISKFGRRTHTRLDLICDDDVYVGELAERLVQFAGVDRLRITGLTFLPEVGSDAAAMAVKADFGDLILVTITTITGIEWTAPVQVFGVQHTVSDEVWETVLLTDDTLFTGEFYAFNQLAFDSLAFS